MTRKVLHSPGVSTMSFPVLGAGSSSHPKREISVWLSWNSCSHRLKYTHSNRPIIPPGNIGLGSWAFRSQRCGPLRVGIQVSVVIGKALSLG